MHSSTKANISNVSLLASDLCVFCAVVSERVSNVLDKLGLELITDREHPAEKGTSLNEKIAKLINMAFATRADEEEWLRRWDVRLQVPTKLTKLVFISG